MKRKHRNHSASFNTKVALAAIRAEKSLAELPEQFDAHHNQIQDRRRKLPDQIDQVLDLVANYSVLLWFLEAGPLK